MTLVTDVTLDRITSGAGARVTSVTSVTALNETAEVLREGCFLLW